MKRHAALAMVLFRLAPFAFAGGLDKSKEMDTMTLKGTLLCVGCNLKKFAECSLFAHHAIEFKTEDGTLSRELFMESYEPG